MSRARLNPELPRCRCGRRMEPTYVRNSGTTYVAAACPLWGGAPWKDNGGHQYVMTDTPEHRAYCGCLGRRGLWEVRA